jgi:hypothetical protein
MSTYIKEIQTQHNEKELHKFMKENYSLYNYEENVFPKQPDQKKTEYYYGTKPLFEFFVLYVENIICDYKYKMEIEKTKQKEIEKDIKRMEIEGKTKQDIEKTKQLEIEKDIKQIEKDIKKTEIVKLFLEKNLSLDDIPKYI